MTACTNKARGAVVAALAGALALGAAPAVALAATGAEVSTMSVSRPDAFSKGSLTGATDIDGNPIDIPETGFITFVGDGRPQGIVPTEVTVALGSATVEVPITAGGYELDYFIANDGGVSTGTKTFSGTANEGDAPYAVGKYVARLEMTSGDYDDGVINIPFEIKAGSLEDLSAIDTADGSFVFDGTNQLDNIAYKMGDKLLDKSLFTIKGISYKAGASVPVQSTNEAVRAGDYSVILVGNDGTAYAGTETEVQFTVTPLDLKTADVVFEDVLVSTATATSNYAPKIKYINGKTPSTNLTNELEVTFKSGPEGSNLVWKRGEYTYTVEAKNTSSDVINSTEATFNAVDAVVPASYFTYQGDQFHNMGINLSVGQSFTPDKIAVSYNGETLNSSEYAVTVTNMTTGVTSTDLSLVNTPGAWIVTATVNASAFEWALGGTSTMTILTWAGNIDENSNVYFIYDGKVVSGSTSTEYDGTNKLDDLQVSVSDVFGKVLTEGEDYDVTAYDAAGNAVDEIVDAGTYTIKVSSDSYISSNGFLQAFEDTLTLTVDPVSVYDVRVARDAFQVYGEDAFLPYTGSAIEPAIEYKDSEGNWKTLPAGLYNLTFAYSEDYSGTYSKVDDMVEEGYYKIYLHAVRDNDPNWGLKNDSNKGFWDVDGYEAGHKIVRVTASRLFPDVPTDEWYSQSVYDAVNLGYMNGDGATKLFSPARPLTRAEAVCVLFNMAGGNDRYTDGMFEYDADHGFVTGYSDVDGTQFYAKAVAWAENTGIVNGYPDGTFGVSRYVTSEEFACMLANFAKAKGEDVTVEDADEVLAGYADADSVSDWAKEAVAWAVQEGVMGNSAELAPSGSILRMRVATMVVNYQPEGAFESVFEFESQEQGA